MKTALFVDFDNVYSGLRKLDYALAERFARHHITLTMGDHMHAIAEGFQISEMCLELDGRLPRLFFTRIKWQRGL